ncbi:MAG: prolyl aminopeptidase, partial [bacterium]|nr:prolyl aminopeptidase [bacterium]
MPTLYPPIEPYKTEFLKVSEIHSIYLEQSGNPNGIPIIVLHGGPGGRTKSEHRQIFNPEKFRVIFFDQRGCGKSIPSGETQANTTQDLVEDIEKVRKYLHIDKCIVYGGSWGSALAILYAEMYPESINRLILRSIFLCTKRELDWLFNDDTLSVIYPDVWEKYIGLVLENERGNIMKAYEKMIFGKDKKLQIKAIQLQSFWSLIRQQLILKIEKPEDIIVDETGINGRKILYHYLNNKMFLEEGQLLKNINFIRHIPTVIIHGRYDMNCPLKSAWDLHKAFPEAEFYIIPGASHKFTEPGIMEKLI